jgi:hypothetical protein
MPEANVLYTVTSVVVAGLLVWVVASLKMAKQPWPRPEAAAAIAASKASGREPDTAVEKTEESPAGETPGDEKPETGGPDVTAEATAVKVEDKPEAEEKDSDEKKDEA